MATEWSDIFALNEGVISDPGSLVPGTWLEMPDGSPYEVQEGDDLISIAAQWDQSNPDESIEDPELVEEEISQNDPDADTEPTLSDPTTDAEAAAEDTSTPPTDSPTYADYDIPVPETTAPPANNAGAGGATTQKVVADPAPKLEIRPNPLHAFATYTYSAALFLLSKDDINELATAPELWDPTNCLIASGGKNSGIYRRNKNFKDDFYFENIQMTTVIGLNNRSKSSNAIELSFTVVEPYGMSLLDRIMDAAEEIAAPNFKAMPYLLEIEFYGYTDSGVQVKLENQRKRFPIQIIEFKIKTNTKGSEYSIKAVPWNHQALSQTAASTPINVEVFAATVSEFFSSDDKTLKANGDINERTKQAKSYSVKSYSGGINGWYDELKSKNLRQVADEFAIEIHGSPEVPRDRIANAKIVVPAHKDISRSATKEGKPESAAAAANKPSNSAFGDAMAFPVAAGTSVVQVIDLVMRNSSYITDQISDPKDTKPADLAEKMQKPLYWYKVIPSVEVLKYDYAVNKFATKTTYHIVPYIVYDSKHPNGPVMSPKGAVKKYSYTYTGENVDVLDLQIDFDTLFYTAVTAGSAKWQADQIQKAKEQTDDAKSVAAESKSSARELVNRQTSLVSSQPQQQGLAGQQQSAQTVLAGDIQKSQYSSSRGDMLNLKLKIVGDPELIKQDDVYTNPLQSTYASQMAGGLVGKTGSIAMDSGEVIAQVEFRTIVDMDETTGLPRKTVSADKGVFSGQYRVLTVANTFANGRFEQVLDMVRVPDAINSENVNANRGTSTTPATNLATGSDLALFYDQGPAEGTFDAEPLPEGAPPIESDIPLDSTDDPTADTVDDNPDWTADDEELYAIDTELEPIPEGEITIPEGLTPEEEATIALEESAVDTGFA